MVALALGMMHVENLIDTYVEYTVGYEELKERVKVSTGAGCRTGIPG